MGLALPEGPHGFLTASTETNRGRLFNPAVPPVCHWNGTVLVMAGKRLSVQDRLSGGLLTRVGWR